MPIPLRYRSPLTTNDANAISPSCGLMRLIRTSLTCTAALLSTLTRCRVERHQPLAIVHSNQEIEESGEAPERLGRVGPGQVGRGIMALQGFPEAINTHVITPFGSLCPVGVKASFAVRSRGFTSRNNFPGDPLSRPIGAGKSGRDRVFDVGAQRRVHVADIL